MSKLDDLRKDDLVVENVDLGKRARFTVDVIHRDWIELAVEAHPQSALVDAEPTLAKLVAKVENKGVGGVPPPPEMPVSTCDAQFANAVWAAMVSSRRAIPFVPP